MKVAIAGYGIEGQASHEYYEARGDEVVVVDENESAALPEDTRSILGRDAFSRLEEFDLIVRSPGIAPDKLPYGDKVWSATNEFFARCKAPIIGVTGTKGKGTTSSLIASILRAAGKKVHLVGNIGVPALEILGEVQPDDIVVFELSSFQLWDIERSPQVAVVLMVEQDHLDVHGSFDDYKSAKANITLHQSVDDVVIYHPTNEHTKQIAYSGEARKQRYGTPEDGGVYVKDGSFYADEHAICSVDALHIAGAHNQENACAAITAVRALVPGVTSEQVAEGLSSFMGLPHRLQLIREVNGVRFYDDSISTTPGSAIAALRAFDEPKVIILGGADKGVDYEELVKVCKEVDAKVVAIGQTGEVIAGLCRSYDVPVHELGMATMEVVVEVALESVAAGGVVLLSPASASFDMYINYKQRGDAFMAAVNMVEGV